MATPSRPPLAGCGILVTRPARQAAIFATRLAALGATPVIFPAIVILPPEDRRALESALGQLAQYDVAVFVSANAVEYGVPSGLRWPASVVPVAPGPGTSEALAMAGIDGTQVPLERYDSEGMLALPALGAVKGKRVLLFRGEGGRELLAETLRGRGASVDEVACYRRVVPQTGAAGLVEVMREHRVDAVTITSSEGLDNLWSVLDANGRALLSALPVFVPHERIAQRAAALDLDVRLTRGGDAGLIAGLLEWAARGDATAAPRHDGR